MKYAYQIVVGDWSDDGHGQSDKYPFRCTHSEDEVKAAYHAAVEKCGIGLHDKRNSKDKHVPVLSEFEQNKLTPSQISALAAIGVDLEEIGGIELEDDSCTFYPEGVAELFLEMVKSQLPGFEYKIESPPTIMKSIGYGVYSL